MTKKQLAYAIVKDGKIVDYYNFQKSAFFPMIYKTYEDARDFLIKTEIEALADAQVVGVDLNNLFK